MNSMTSSEMAFAHDLRPLGKMGKQVVALVVFSYAVYISWDPSNER